MDGHLEWVAQQVEEPGHLSVVLGERETLMGHATAWVGFGFLVPEELTGEEMERRLDRKRWPEVSYLAAAGDGHTKTYAVTYAKSAPPGEMVRFSPPHEYWEDRRTEELVEFAKVNGWLAPGGTSFDLNVGWFLIAGAS